MPGLYDMMTGNSSPDTQQGYGANPLNSPLTRYGMQLLQPRSPGYQNLPFYSGGPPPQMQNLPYSGGGAGQLQQLAAPPGGKRRIRIGNKTYEEVTDPQMMQAPSAPPQY